MANEIDFTPYVTPPRIDAASGVVLTRKLIKAAFKSPGPEIRKALKGMRDAALDVQKIGVERLLLRPENLRPYDAKWDNGWGGLFGALGAMARLQGEPDAARAGEILAKLSPSGDLSMLTLAYEDEWYEGEKLLTTIERERLGKEIDRLVGPIFLRYARSAQTELGEALGVGQKSIERASSTGLSEALGDLAAAISDYGRLMSGTVDRKKSSTAKAFLKAMAPLDEHRALRSTTRTTGEPAPEPKEDDLTGPIPPVA